MCLELLLMRKYDWYPKYTANSKKAASLERGYWAVFSLISGGRLEEGEKLKKLLKKLDQHSKNRLNGQVHSNFIVIARCHGFAV